MGNVVVGSCVCDEEFNKLLDSFTELNPSMLFNDSFISQVYHKLPNYEGTEIFNEEKVDEDAAEERDGEEIVKLNNLMSIFGSSKITTKKSCEDFPFLNARAELDHSDFVLHNKMRTRVLMAFHKAFVIKNAVKNSSNNNNSTVDTSSGSEVDESDITSSKGESSYDEDSESVLLKPKDTPLEVLLTITSTMCLQIARTLGKENSALNLTLADTVTNLLKNSSQLSFYNLGNSMLAKTLSNINDFAEDMSASSTGQSRSAALGLLIAVAITSGSFSKLLNVATLLQNGEGGETIPANCMHFLASLEKREQNFELDIPLQSRVVNQFQAQLIASSSKVLSTTPPSLATDGEFLYVFDANTCSIKKIGSGLHGTMAGSEVTANLAVREQLIAFLGIDDSLDWIAEEKEEKEDELAESKEEVGQGHMREFDAVEVALVS